MFYEVMITLMNKFPPIRGLRPKELEVLTEIMLQNHVNKDIKDFNKRQLIIFSTDTRIKMAEHLNMSRDSFNNYLKNIKKKGIVSKDNKLLPFLDITPDKEYSLDFKFTIHE